MRKIWLLCLFLLTACAGPRRATPAPTPEVLNVAVTPSLRPFVETLHTCATGRAEFVINVYETPTSTLENLTVDLILRFGSMPWIGYAAAIGDESLVLIVNASNPVLTLSVEQLHDIFTGRISSWDEVGGMPQPVQIWAYPAGDDARELLDKAIYPAESITPGALVAPNPPAMLEAVGDNPLAIGYIPQAWLAQASSVDQVRLLNIDQKLAEKLRQPVLALTREAPEGALSQLLVCLQSNGR